MWTTLACVAALGLAPSQGGQLTLSNPQATYGLFGAPRTDNKLLPGDIFFVAFEIENITVDKTGKVLYSMGMEVVDSKNMSVYKQDPRDLEALNSLGGTRLPAFAHVYVGLDQPAGEYTLKVTVTDRGTKAKSSKTLERKFEVVPLTFGIVRLQLSTIVSETPERFPTPPTAVAGQSLWVNFAIVGFDRDKKTNAPQLKVEMRALEDGKPTMANPFVGAVSKEIPANFKIAPMQFWLPLNRSGKFTIELKVTDEASKPVKVTKMTFPVTVLPLK